MNKTISYEFIIGSNSYGIRQPKYEPHQQCVWRKETEGVQLIICKAIDFNTELNDWKYQAISLVTNKYVFVLEQDLTDEMP